MLVRNLRRAGTLAAIAALSIAALASVGASASSMSKGAEEPTAATITLVSNGNSLEFTGPRKVSAGAKLQIVNATNPRKVGPHTFSLVKENLLPQTDEEIKDCEKLKTEVCLNVLKAQKADPETGEVGRPIVEVGKKGWDRSFGKKGDTWFTEAEGDTHDRQVSAKAGTTLYYFCIVHPFMQGKIKVVK